MKRFYCTDRIGTDKRNNHSFRKRHPCGYRTVSSIRGAGRQRTTGTPRFAAALRRRQPYRQSAQRHVSSHQLSDGCTDEQRAIRPLGRRQPRVRFQARRTARSYQFGELPSRVRQHVSGRYAADACRTVYNV